jgi:LPS export ABC transporter protein LptC
MLKIPLKYLPIIGIALIFAVIAFFLIKADHKGIEAPLLTDLISEEGLNLKNIHYIQDNPEKGARWVLDADEVKFSKDRKHISFNKFRLKLEPENDLSMELVGKSGDYNQVSNEINLRGGLEGYTSSGYRIKTEQILFKQKEGYLKTDETVRLIGPFFTLEGRGLIVNLNRETLKILSDVHTKIDKESLVL